MAPAFGTWHMDMSPTWWLRLVKVKLYRAACRHVLKSVAIILVAVAAVVCHLNSWAKPAVIDGRKGKLANVSRWLYFVARGS